MATVKRKNEGKSMFLKEYLVDHPDAGKETIDAPWREAGNEGAISTSLIGKVRKDLGPTGNRTAQGKSRRASGRASGRRMARSPTPAVPAARSEAELRRRITAGMSRRDWSGLPSLGRRAATGPAC